MFFIIKFNNGNIKTCFYDIYSIEPHNRLHFYNYNGVNRILKFIINLNEVSSIEIDETGGI